jgi:hypothetical protein
MCGAGVAVSPTSMQKLELPATDAQRHPACTKFVAVAYSARQNRGCLTDDIEREEANEKLYI